MFNLEKGLGEIEATASAVIGKTDNDEQLSDGDRLTLATYMAFQHTRTPAYRGWLEAIQAGGRRAEGSMRYRSQPMLRRRKGGYWRRCHAKRHGLLTSSWE